jgi:ribonuclease HII
MKFLLGVDEAGRGPLAGPVAVGVVMVPEGFDIRAAFPGVGDSKKLSEKSRERIFALLLESPDVRYSVQMATAATIDSIGITKSVIGAVHEGIRVLAPDPCGVRVVLDGLLHAPLGYEQETIIRGDDTEPAISLASIAAKVTRDHFMLEMAEKYPEYGFSRHKGYGTALHYEALQKYGPCEIHRRSFLHIVV